MSNGHLRPALSEGLGTVLLLFVIVGSGITAESSSGDPGVQLVLHAIAVGSGLAVLVAVLGRVSGAHFNPAVTLGFWRRHILDTPTAVAYVSAQMVGAIAGVGVANLVFEETLFAVASTGSVSLGAAVGELIGTLFLVLLILTLVDQERTAWIPASVGAWVAAMMLAAPSGGLLNPAVTLSRTLTDTYTGVAPSAAAVFVGVQLLAGAAAVLISRQLVGVPELEGA